MMQLNEVCNPVGMPCFMQITLYSYDYSQQTAAQQMTKLLEELKELEETGDDLNLVTKEVFDVIQALIGYLITLGVDVEVANEWYLGKGRIGEIEHNEFCWQCNTRDASRRRI